MADPGKPNSGQNPPDATIANQTMADLGSGSAGSYDATINVPSSAGAGSTRPTPKAGDQTIVDAPAPRPNTTQADRTIFEPGQRGGSSPADAAAAPKTIAEFTERLQVSGLMSVEEVDAFQKTLRGDDSVGDASSLAAALVKANKLSSYQADAIARGQVRGLVLGNYVIVDKLGEGGMGMVFKARHRRMKRTVALKVLPPEMTRSSDAINRFHREVEAAAKLTHSNIAAAYDADEDQGIHFLVMEHVDGPNLSSYVKQAGPLPVPAAVALMVQAARGLGHAHAQGIVHRDIKPGNLLVNREGVLKILDMGLAQLKADADEDPHRAELTQSGRVMGTVDYMAPEQALDAKRVDQRADIYSLGCSLYYLLVGKPMSPEGTLTQKLLWHQNAPVPSLKELVPGVTDRVDDVFRRMVAKKPEDRPASMTEVVELLSGCLSELPSDGLKLELLGIAVSSGSPSTNDGSKIGVTMVERPTRTDLGGLLPAQADAGGSSWLPYAGLALALALLGGLGAMLLLPYFAQDGSLVVVLDPQVADAKIEIDNAPVPTTVDAEGRHVHRRKPGTYALGVTAPGFRPYLKEGVEVTAGTTTTERVFLVPLEAAPVEPVPNPPTGNPDPMPGTGGNGKTDPNPMIAVPLPPRPYEKLLGWVFANRGQATIVLDKGGAEQTHSQLEDVPRESFRIKSLDLARSPLRDDDLSHLDEAKGLERLSLSGTAISNEGLLWLRKLKDLTTLDLSHTQITNPGLEHVATLPQLLDLNLSHTSVTDAGIKTLSQLPRLQKLFLAQTKIGDGACTHLAVFKALKEVSLNGTFVTNEGYDMLAAANAGLNIAWDGRDVDRAVAYKLFARGPGVVLTLTTRSGEALEAVKAKADLPRERFTITAIDLTDIPAVDDTDLAEVAKLEKLQELRVGGTGITGTGLGHLHKLAELRRVDLGSLQLPQPAVDALASALPGAKIDLKPSSDLAAATWVLQRKGKVAIELPDGERRVDVTDPAELPKGIYTLRAVDLSGNQSLTSGDLAILKDLAGLESLKLSDTGIDNSGLPHLIGCKSLRELDLSRTKVDATGFAAIAKLRTLLQLRLDDCPVDAGGMQTLAPLVNLTHLSLAGTGLKSGDLVALKSFPRLTSLSLERTGVDDAALPQLQKLTSLTRIVLVGTQVTDAGAEELKMAMPSCEVIPNEKNYERLAARWVMQQGGQVRLAGEMTALKPEALPRGACVVEEIDLASLRQVAPAQMVSVIRRCPKLTRLNLSGTNVADGDLANLGDMPELAELSLNETAVTDAGLAHLAKLPKLKVLRLSQLRNLTGIGFSKLAGLEQLAQLDLSYTAVDPAGMAAIAKLPALTSLDLTYARQFSDSAAAQLPAAKQLRELKLRNTSIGDPAVKSVVQLTQLVWLDLSGTRIDDEAVGQLASLKQLQRLELNGCKITDSSVGLFTSLPALKVLDISRTYISDGSVSSLQAKFGAGLSSGGRRKENPNAPGQPGFPPGTGIDMGPGGLFPRDR